MTHSITETARSLRREQTPAESALWRRLRAGQLCGFKFRRQHPIGRFVADFCCEESRLVIEIDGDTHVGREAQDHSRTRYIAEQGYRVIRVTNPDVYDNIEGALELILMECSKRTGG